MTNIKSKALGYGCFIYICICWGTIFVFLKLLIKSGLPALEVVSLRCFLSGVLILFYFILQKKARMFNIFKNIKLFLLSVLTFLLLGLFNIYSLKFIHSDLLAFINALFPIIMILIESFYFKKIKLNTMAILGIFISFSGLIALTFFDKYTIYINEIDFNFHFWLGVFLGFLALLSWCILSIILTKNDINVDNNYMLGLIKLVSSFFIFLFSIFDANEKFVSLNQEQLFIILFLSLVSNVLGFIAFNYCLKVFGVGITSLYAYITPNVTIWFAWIFLDEIVTPLTVLASLITLSGVFIVNYSLAKQVR
ncbi:MAG: DMT family transporter [Alphaproteobacteria bacterium]|nr:DMT family transporter [Alphaproteobacteria bacterium]